MTFSQGKCWLVIPAAGVGSRMGSGPPKQYRELWGKPLLEQTLSPFLACGFIAGVVVSVANEDDVSDLLSNIDDPRLSVCIGGNTRTASVLAGLLSLEAAGKDDWVMVHDAARPCVTAAQVTSLFDALKTDAVGGIWAIPATDTLKLVSAGAISKTVDRSVIWRAQTPQMFRHGALQAAITDGLESNYDITDEASAMEYAGYQPKVVKGPMHNIKVTYPEEFTLAELYLKYGFGG